MEVLLVLGYIILLTLTVLVIKSKLNRIPLLMFLSWWGILFIISLTNPYDLYPVSSSTYVLIFINCFMFFLGYLTVTLKRKNYKLNIDVNFSDLNKILLTLQIIIMPILVYYVIKYQLLLNSLGHTYARVIKYDLGLLFGSVYESALYSYVLSPILLITSILTAIKFIQRDIKSLTFILMLINVILNTQIGLGRFGYFELIMFMLIVYLFFKNENKHKFVISKMKIGQKIIIFVSCFLLVTLMNYTLLIRKGYKKVDLDSIIEGYDILFDQAITYFIGPFRALDHLLTNGIQEYFSYFYGRLTFGGVDHIFGMFFKLIDSDYKTAYQIVTPFTQNPIIIGDGKSFNAFYTSLMNHYLDLNVIGIIILPLLNGMFVAYVVNLFIKNQSIASLSLLVFVVYNAIISSLKWSYQDVSTWIALILLVIFYVYQEKNKKRTNKEKDKIVQFAKRNIT